MNEPNWLNVTIVSDIQLQLLARCGGIEGIRELNLLESAIHGPIQLFSYGEPDMCDLATSYAFGIVRNHPFLDGNKRAGFMAAYTFLGINGLDLTASEAEATVMTIGLAAGDVPPEGYSQWLRDNTEPLQD